MYFIIQLLTGNNGCQISFMSYNDFIDVIKCNGLSDSIYKIVYMKGAVVSHMSIKDEQNMCVILIPLVFCSFIAWECLQLCRSLVASICFT